MRISVIVPLFNKEPWVRRCIDSILRQSLGDFEVIVVDDGSTDRGPEHVSRYKDRRVRLLRQGNAGPGAARNRGIREAKGELLAFLDADDAWLPEYLASNVRCLDEAGPEVAAVTCGYIDEPEGISRERLWRNRGLLPGWQRVTATMAPVRLQHMLAYMSPCTTVVRTAAVKRWGGFYDVRGCRYGEDAMLWLKVLLNETVWFDLTPLAVFHRDASALSRTRHASRPVEPFLMDPDEIRRSCPDMLRGLLERFLSLRACKTAAVMGYWGEARAARELLRRFVTARACVSPFYPCALVGCTPLGGWIGRAWREWTSSSESYVHAASSKG